MSNTSHMLFIVAAILDSVTKGTATKHKEEAIKRHNY